MEVILIEITYSTKEQGLDFNVKTKHADAIESQRLNLITLFERWLVALREGTYPFRFEGEKDETPV